MSHRIRELSAFASLALFYPFAALYSISGLFGHQRANATTRSSLPDIRRLVSTARGHRGTFLLESVSRLALKAVPFRRPEAKRGTVDALYLAENLLWLLGGVPIVGSDHYGEDSLHEADYLHSLGIWSNIELLRMWSVETPQVIFPHRAIGGLKPGYEASFLILAASPLKDWSATHLIVDLCKQGVRIEPR
jgi:hypothetical protein